MDMTPLRMAGPFGAGRGHDDASRSPAAALAAVAPGMTPDRVAARWALADAGMIAMEAKIQEMGGKLLPWPRGIGSALQGPAGRHGGDHVSTKTFYFIHQEPCKTTR